MVGNGGSEQSPGYALSFSTKLRRTVHGMSNLLPVDQVGAFEDRKPGKLGEGRIGHVKFIACSADSEVRIKSGEDGILVGRVFIRRHFLYQQFFRLTGPEEQAYTQQEDRILREYQLFF